MELDQIRENIDQVDTALTELLEKRLELVYLVAEFKKEQNLPVLDEAREAQLLRKIAAQVKNPKFTESILATYRQLFKNSRDFQTKMM